VWVYDISTGKKISQMEQPGVIYSITISPDNKFIATASVNKTARIWQISTGKEIVRIPHPGWVGNAIFSPDGKYLVTTAEDNIIRLWKWSAPDLVAEACSHLTRNLTPTEWDLYVPDRPYQAICPNLP
jgi:WD40 repeat protein